MTDYYKLNMDNLPNVSSEIKNPFDTQVGGSHYKSEVINSAEFCIRNKVRSAESNIIKYVMRHPNKNGLEDLRKAKHYLEMIAFCDYNSEL